MERRRAKEARKARRARKRAQRAFGEEMSRRDREMGGVRIARFSYDDCLKAKARHQEMQMERREVLFAAAGGKAPAVTGPGYKNRARARFPC